MKKEKIYLVLFIIFIILTFIGAGYVVLNNGEPNAGYAVIPILFGIIFCGLYKQEKKEESRIMIKGVNYGTTK